MIQAKLMAVMLILLVLLGSMFALYRYGRHVQFVIDDTKAKAAIYKVTMENDKLKVQLEKDHANSETIINTLLATPAPIVRLPTSNCKTKPATGSIQGQQTGGILFESVEGILSAERQRAFEIVGACEIDLANANVVKAWAVSLP